MKECLLSEEVNGAVGVRHFYHSVHGGCLSGNEAKEETLTGMEMTAHGSACLWRDRLIIILEYMEKGKKLLLISRNALYYCLYKIKQVWMIVCGSAYDLPITSQQE